MAINAKNAPRGGKAIEPMDPGTYPARLVQIIDFGLQPQTYNGETKAPKQEIGTTYEMLDEFLKDDDGNDIEDKPRWVGETFPLNHIDTERAKSTIRYLALDPELKDDGDWEAQLGKPVMVTIVQNPGTGKNKGRIFEKITSVSAMRPKEAAKAPKLVNEPRFLDLTDTSQESLDLFVSLPDWIKDKIKKGLEWQGSDFQLALEGHQPKEDKAPAKKREVAEIDDSIPTEDETPDEGW